MKLDFKEIGEGYFVELKNYKTLSWKSKKEILSGIKDDSMESNLDAAERIAIAMIKSGYLLDENNRPIQFPLTTETVGDVPADVIEAVAKEFSEAAKKNTSKN